MRHRGPVLEILTVARLPLWRWSMMDGVVLLDFVSMMTRSGK